MLKSGVTSEARPVGIVIVSHSIDIAEGITKMIVQSVSDTVPVCACGGNADGGLGTDVSAISNCIDKAWSDAGVVILVDLGSSEMNSEIAIELLAEPLQHKVLICNAPIVEGAIMAANESYIGKSLEEVRQAAEEAL